MYFKIKHLFDKLHFKIVVKCVKTHSKESVLFNYTFNFIKIIISENIVFKNIFSKFEVHCKFKCNTVKHLFFTRDY